MIHPFLMFLAPDNVATQGLAQAKQRVGLVIQEPLA